MAKPEETRSAALRSYYKRSREVKAEMIEVYGGKCACCGESNPAFLTLDHKDGRPPAHRRSDNYGSRNNKTGFKLWMIARKEGWPDTYQILCFNCNCARANNGGVCPHRALELLVA